MKKIWFTVCAFVLLFNLSACAGQDNNAGNTGEPAAVLPSGTQDIRQTDLSADLSGEDGEAEQVSMDQVGTETENESNILVVYFSATGNTKALAEYAADALGADIFEIVPEEPYTDEDLDYGDDLSRTSLEMNDADVRPAICSSVENMERYEIIFLGYPNMEQGFEGVLCA